MVIEDGRFEYARRHEAIAREAQLDGLYILRASEPEQRLGTADVVFRHRTETRVRLHLFLCVIGYVASAPGPSAVAVR